MPVKTFVTVLGTKQCTIPSLTSLAVSKHLLILFQYSKARAPPSRHADLVHREAQNGCHALKCRIEHFEALSLPGAFFRSLYQNRHDIVYFLYPTRSGIPSRLALGAPIPFRRAYPCNLIGPRGACVFCC